jgi:hypothetical protein
MDNWKTFTNGIIISAIFFTLCYTVLIDRYFVSKSTLAGKNPHMYFNGNKYTCHVR